MKYFTKAELDKKSQILMMIPPAPRYVSNKILRMELDWTAGRLNYYIKQFKAEKKIIEIKHGNIHYYQRVAATA